MNSSGCLFIVLLVVLIAAGFADGLTGIGLALLAIGFFGVLFSIGAGSWGGICIAICLGAAGIGLVSIGGQKGAESLANDSYNSLSGQSSVEDYQRIIAIHYNDLNAIQQDDVLRWYYSRSLDLCSATIGIFSSGTYSQEPSGLGYLKDFIGHCPSSIYKDRAQERVRALVDSLYYEASRKNTYAAWKEYRLAVPVEDYKDSDERMAAADTRWSSDRAAWATALSLNSIAGYKKYLSLFPNGRHRREADKKLIDMSVAFAFAGEHGDLPQMDQVVYGGGSTATISVTNRTSYTLTLMYSGNESKRLVLSPKSTGSVRLKNGSYRIVASIDASNVRDYAGVETIKGGAYEVEYYISTAVPSYRYR